MNKKTGVYIYLAVLSAHITGLLTDNQIVQFITKPLLLACLLVYFIFQTSSSSGKQKNWIVLALGFSWCGDVLLMFQEYKPIFFLSGLCSFLAAHIFYILFFQSVRKDENIALKPLPVIVVVFYYTGLIFWLSPYLGEMRIPVWVYGLVISTMLLLALHLYFIKNRRASWLIISGAILFIISDSVLAINKFYQPFEWAGVFIMLTYGIAQLLIVQGAIKKINASN